MSIKKVFMFMLVVSLSVKSASAHLWDAYYAGIMVGYDFGNFKLVSGSDSLKGYVNSQSNKINFNGPSSEFIFGYGKMFDDRYIGIDSNISLSKAKGKSSVVHDEAFVGSFSKFETKINKKSSYQVTFRVGYKIQENLLPYIKIGAVSTRFNLKCQNTNTALPEESFSIYTNKSLNGYVGALGVETKFSELIFGRFEFTYIRYNKKNIIGTSIGNFINSSFRPQSNEIKLGVFVPLV